MSIFNLDKEGMKTYQMRPRYIEMEKGYSPEKEIKYKKYGYINISCIMYEL